jgi:hypothetical protein
VTTVFLPPSRSASQITLDSIDQLTRYSEDTDRKEEDRLAILEYELRTSRFYIFSFFMLTAKCHSCKVRCLVFTFKFRDLQIKPFPPLYHLAQRDSSSLS